MFTSDRRGFLTGTAASLVVAGLTGAARVAAAQTGSTKMKPTAQDVLLVIDVQNCFTPGGSLAVKEGDQIIPLINRLATGFEHVVLTQDWHTPGHVSFASSHPGKKPFETTQLPYGTQVLWPDHCVQGTPGADLHKDLRIPHAELIIRKGYRKQMDSYSAFYEADGKTPTGLTGYLKDRGLNQVFLRRTRDRLLRRLVRDGRAQGGLRRAGHRGRLPRHRRRRLAREGLEGHARRRGQAHQVDGHRRLGAAAYEMARAIRKAAAAATPPMRRVCSAVRTGQTPVRRPRIQPKTRSAVPVTAMDQGSAVCALGSSM